MRKKLWMALITVCMMVTIFGTQVMAMPVFMDGEWIDTDDPDPDPDPDPVPDPIPDPVPAPAIKLPTPNAVLDLSLMILSDYSGYPLSYSINDGQWTSPSTRSCFDLSDYYLDGNDYIDVKYVAADGSDYEDSDEQTIFITQASRPSGISVTDAVGSDNGSINGVNGSMEYTEVNGFNYKPITGDTVSVKPSTYFVRVRATRNRLASDPVTVTVGKKQPQTKMSTPIASFNAMNMTLSNVGNGVLYSYDGCNWTKNGGNTNVLVTDAQAQSALSHMILLKMPGDGNSTIDSDVEAIKITKACTPNGLAAVGAKGGNNGQILNVKAGYQYRAAGTANWLTATGVSIAGLAPGNYEVRIGGYYNALASDIVTVTVGTNGAATKAGKSGTPSADFDAQTGCLTEILGNRFSIDGGKTWSPVCTANSIILDTAKLSTKCGIEVYRPGDGLTTKDSGIQLIKLAKATAPKGITTTPASALANGSINNLNGTLDISADGKKWAHLEKGMRAHPAAAGTYYVRTEGHSTTLPSDAVKVTVAKIK